MLEVTIPTTKKKIEKQIGIIQYALSIDTSEVDKSIHQQSLDMLRESLAILK
jgi:hypothetical protein